MRDIVRGNMRTQMMNGNKRNARGKRKSLCVIHADKQRTYKSRCICNGDCVNIGYFKLCFFKRLVHDVAY